MTITLDEQIAFCERRISDLETAHNNLKPYTSEWRLNSEALDMARAILTTLRACKEPTEEMVEAGKKAIEAEIPIFRDCYKDGRTRAVKGCFHAMLNARGG